MMDYPPRKSQTIPPYLLQNQAQRLKDLNRAYNQIDESSTETDVAFGRSYRRLPRVIPLEPDLTFPVYQTDYIKDYLKPSNVIIVSGEKLQPSNWKRRSSKQRRHRSLVIQKVYPNTVDARDRASSPILALEHDSTSCTTTLMNETNCNFPTDHNNDTENSTPTVSRTLTRTLDLGKAKDDKLTVPCKTTKLFGSVRSNTSEDDQRALITASSTFDASNSEAVSQAIEQPTITKQQELISDVSLLENSHKTTREIAIHRMTSPSDKQKTAQVISPMVVQRSVSLQSVSVATPKFVTKVNCEPETNGKLPTLREEKMPPSPNSTFSVFLTGPTISDTYTSPEIPHTVTTSLKVQRIYTKPPRLHREPVTNEANYPPPEIPPRCASPLVRATRRPITATSKTQMWENRFVTRPMTDTELPENKSIEISNQFGNLNSHIESITLRLHDFSVIPGGPWRGIIYIIVKNTFFLSEIVLIIEEMFKYSSSKGKNDFEKVHEYTHTCLSSDSALSRRDPPNRFHYELSEFIQSATAPVKRDELCYQPYSGPIEFKPGHYAIPCIFPIDAKRHPSFMLRQNANTPNALELSNSYCIYAKLQCSKDQFGPTEEITTGRLPMKLMSCGPLPPELDNGEPVPSLIHTFALPDVNLMIQAENLTVQDGDTVRFYLYADQVGVIKHVRAFLLQIFHIPILDISDEKSLYKAKKFPDNVVVRDQTEEIPMTAEFSMPFSPLAEAKTRDLMNQFENANFPRYQFHSFSVTNEDVMETEETPLPSQDLPWDDRKAGCTISLTVPMRTVPQIQMDDVRVTYYVRILIHLKKKTTAYSIPITVVETRVRDYKMEYLGGTHPLEDKAFLKMERDSRCLIS